MLLDMQVPTNIAGNPITYGATITWATSVWSHSVTNPVALAVTKSAHVAEWSLNFNLDTLLNLAVIVAW